jgi:D-serine deaminase-like pyridoxal phosphate-dependent protein
MIAGSPSFDELARDYPIGARVRVIPNHACLTAAPYDRYYLVRGSDTRVEGVWPKLTGWSGQSQ